MNTITRPKSDETEMLHQFSQHTNQFENLAVEIHRHLDTGEMLYREYTCADDFWYSLDADDLESIEAAPMQWLRDMAHDWADTEDSDNSSYPLAHAAWFGADTLAVTDDWDGECHILITGNYYGYQPVDFAAPEGLSGSPIVFADRAEAQRWIDEQSGIYYCSHNEAGRPSYTIVAA